MLIISVRRVNVVEMKGLSVQMLSIPSYPGFFKVSPWPRHKVTLGVYVDPDISH